MTIVLVRICAKKSCQFICNRLNFFQESLLNEVIDFHAKQLRTHKGTQATAAPSCHPPSLNKQRLA